MREKLGSLKDNLVFFKNIFTFYSITPLKTARSFSSLIILMRVNRGINCLEYNLRIRKKMYSLWWWVANSLALALNYAENHRHKRRGGS